MHSPTSITPSKPGDNFYLYANGAWINRTTIPADRIAVGNFSLLDDRADKQVADIIAKAAQSNPAPNTDLRRIADLYHSYMDESAIEHHGLSALQPDLTRIAAIKTQPTSPAPSASPSAPTSTPST